DRLRRIQVLKTSEVQPKRHQHRNHREHEKEEPLLSGVMGGNDFPGWIHDEPEKRGAADGVHQHNPTIVAREDTVSTDVVKGERKSCEQRREYAKQIETKSAGAEDPNH